MGKTIQVKYMWCQGAEDLFKNTETKRVYARLSLGPNGPVRWCTTAKTKSGIYEADCSLKADITVQVVDKNGNVLFEELNQKDSWHGGTTACKVGQFSWEVVKEISSGIAKKMQLKSYEEWKKWLMASAAEYGFKGYSDNWCHWKTEEVDSHVIGHACFYGDKVKIVQTDIKHLVCDKTWSCIEIEGSDTDGPFDICGFLWEE